ncbi:hypothetical protein POKO110462_12230 [Pontibacter korlensis]|uniref:Uncharacterized protein n=1 Tax=Pontibacter korlensis TaxID=400092 RepID=A0A0E3ZC99_9BACT|nr:hypothetical protein [Pontibacter korlensis]AKD02484.1 hypothetical protein PKOR_04325 [Pontibacter korlensis]
MKKTFPLFTTILLLLLFGCQEEKNIKVCENFQLLGSFNKGEKVSIKFNSKVIHEGFFEDKSWIVSQLFCVDYTDTFRVDFRVVKKGEVVLDTSMVGYSGFGNYLLALPKGRPTGDLLEKVRADIDFYETIPPDSLVRTAEPELIVSH